MSMNQPIFVSRLDKIRELNSKFKDFVNKNIYQLLTKEEALLAGYEKIKSNKGATTPGTVNTSLDGFSVTRLRRLQAALREEKWQPLPARRIYIPKPGKVEKRPLGIQGPEEKVVQSVVAFILDAIYGPCFSKNSFGFIQSRGVHDALKMIDQNYDGIIFAIEGDIKGMYDNVNHHKLIKLIKKKIDDDRFVRLMWKLLRAGYMDQGKIINPILGTPQGSIVSPHLANIYLHELDRFMDQLCKDVEKRTPNRRTLAFKQIESESRKIKRLLEAKEDPQEIRGVALALAKQTPTQQERVKADIPSIGWTRGLLIQKLKECRKRALQTRMYLKPSDRMLYTRYADDFIVGIAGSRQLAQDTKEKIKEFLKTLSLTLNEDKTNITELRREDAIFLGHKIGINTKVKVAQVRVKNRSPFMRRVTGKFVRITAPYETIVKKLHERGFCDRKGYPTHKTVWITQEDNQIIALFNTSSRGLFNFYSGVKQKHRLSRIKYIFKFSCAMTLAAKHSCSLSKIFQKHGSNLQVTYGSKGEKQVSLYQPDLKNRHRAWQTGKDIPDPYQYIATRLRKTRIYDKCCICGDQSAEMHHVRHLKDSRKNDPGRGFTRRIMGLINRKQIPVCKECDQAIHAGRYDGITLKDLPLLGKARKETL